MPEESLIRTLLLPELSLTHSRSLPFSRTVEVELRKETREEYCPRCATRSVSGYDHRHIRSKMPPCEVSKRGFWSASAVFGASLVRSPPPGEMRPRGLKQVGKTKYDGNRCWRKDRCQDCGAILRTAGEVGVRLAKKSGSRRRRSTEQRRER